MRSGLAPAVPPGDEQRVKGQRPPAVEGARPKPSTDPSGATSADAPRAFVLRSLGSGDDNRPRHGRGGIAWAARARRLWGWHPIVPPSSAAVGGPARAPGRPERRASADGRS